MITEQEINNAKGELKGATIAHHHISTRLANSKAELETAKAQELAAGRITGKNAELREASARELFGEMYEEIEHLQSEYDNTKLELDLAKIEDSRVSMLLRFAEIPA
jgi:hypothetical protein